MNLKERLMRLDDRQARQVLHFLFGACKSDENFQRRLRDGVEWMEKSRITKVQDLDEKEMG